MAVAAVNLPLDDLPIRDLVSERVGLPIFVDNNGNVAALAEYLDGAAQGKPNTVMLTVGTGSAAGLGGEDHPAAPPAPAPSLATP